MWLQQVDYSYAVRAWDELMDRVRSAFRAVEDVLRRDRGRAAFDDANETIEDFVRASQRAARRESLLLAVPRTIAVPGAPAAALVAGRCQVTTRARASVGSRSSARARRDKVRAGWRAKHGASS